MLSSGRDRNFPRSCGIMQKLHGWSPPSAILMYAEARGVVRILGVSAVYRYVGNTATAPSQPSRENLPAASRASPSGRPPTLGCPIRTAASARDGWESDD